jgi:NAD(P)-dependent dehydrogenase (short-subunit alcohol dehydrogenase family)
MVSKITRRRFIQDSSAFAIAALVSKNAWAQTPNPYIGPFDKEATGEEVTKGLNLSGKTVVITGANSGLGYETMRVLAMRGAHIIALARNIQKAKKACAGVGGKTTPVACELTDFNSIVACTKTIQGLNKPIDVLICNAGVMELPEPEQVYGIEKHFVINHLGHFILTNRLLDQVKAAQQGRVVVLSSGRYKSAPPEGIQFDNLSGEKDYDPLTAYGHSKLANALFAQELSRRLKDTAVTSNSLLPGVIMTNLGRHMPSWKLTLSKLIGWTFMRSVEQGVATSCYVATNPKLVKVSGHMFFNCNPITPEGPHMSDRALAKKLWDVSSELTKDYL